MAFDIREIFTRTLGGRRYNDVSPPKPAPSPEEDEFNDDTPPESPINAARSSAAAPEADDLTQGGATASTAFIPEGLEALPSAAVDDTSSAANDEAVSSEQADAVAEVAIAAVLADGELFGDERADLFESLREMPGLENLDSDDLDVIADYLLRMAPERRRFPDTFVAAMEDRLDDLSTVLTDPALRRAAYQLAVYFCAWDGTLTDAEIDFLAAVAEAFEISDFEARALREATMIEAGFEFDEPPLDG